MQNKFLNFLLFLLIFRFFFFLLMYICQANSIGIILTVILLHEMICNYAIQNLKCLKFKTGATKMLLNLMIMHVKNLNANLVSF